MLWKKIILLQLREAVEKLQVQVHVTQPNQVTLVSLKKNP